MEAKESFKKFSDKIKKYPTNEVAKAFGSWERKCWDLSRDDKLLEETYGEKFSKQTIIIKPWLIPEIIYYSTKQNDYKNALVGERQIKELYGLYQNYDMDKEGEFVSREQFNESEYVNYLFYGLGQQQFKFQKTTQYTKRFSRSIYLLKDFILKGIGLDSIIQEKLEMSFEEFVDNLVLITTLSTHYVVLNDEVILKLIKNTQNFIKVLEYLAVSYDDVRESSLKENIFKTKPVLLSQKGEYIVPSFCLLRYNLGDILYWMIKDKFQSTSDFVNSFGLVFENYVFEILFKQYGDCVKRIPTEEGKKSADFCICCNDMVFIIEVKSKVAKLDAKNVIFNDKSIQDYVKSVIVEPLEQIDATAENFKDKRIVPMIINYDVIFTEESLMHDIGDLYIPKNFNQKDTILLGIDDFENLISTYSNLQSLCDLVEEVTEHYKDKTGGLKIYKILENVENHKNVFYDDKFQVNRELLISR